MIIASAISPEPIKVPPVPQPPISHHVSLSGHHEGEAGCSPHTMPNPIKMRQNIADTAIRGQDLTLSPAVLSAARRIGSNRRSAHSCWVASKARPANSASKPGPGKTRAAMPKRTRSQPRLSIAIRLALRRMKSIHPIVMHTWCNGDRFPKCNKYHAQTNWQA
jgi:hypothetical protein